MRYITYILTFLIVFSAIGFTVSRITNEGKYQKLVDDGIIPKLDRSDTLGGVDSDGNGIRDDVDEYIDKTYTDIAQRKAARQIARVFQKELLIDLNNKKSVNDISRYSTKAIHCVVSVAPDKNIMEDIRTVTYNTKKRVERYFEFDNLRDGTVISLPEGDTCEK